MSKKIKGTLTHTNKADYTYTYLLKDDESIEKAITDLEGSCFDNSDDTQFNSAEGIGGEACDESGEEIEYSDFAGSGETSCELGETLWSVYTWFYKDGTEKVTEIEEETEKVFDQLRKKGVEKRLPIKLEVSTGVIEYEDEKGVFTV